MTVPTATVKVDLGDFTGADRVPAAALTLVLDPKADRPWPDGTVTVGKVTVAIDPATGLASAANGVAVTGGVVTLAAGVVYEVTGTGSVYTIGPLAASQTYTLGALVVPGTALTPTAESALALRLSILEATPPGSIVDATATTKGAVALAGDLGGTAAAPTVPGLASKVTAAQAAAAAPVQSVAGRTGTVTLAKADVGLSSVDNTPDSAKPVSTPMAAALAGKVDGTDPRLTDARTPLAHTHTAGQVSDATTVGRSVLTAADAAAARGAIGAGTSSLTLGVTAGTAKAGDYVPSWGEVTGKPALAPVDGQYAVVTASASGAYAVPLSPGVILTLTGNTTLSLPSPAQGFTVLIRITGAFALTWPASVASPPAYTSGATYAVSTLDGGTSWLCKVAS